MLILFFHPYAATLTMSLSEPLAIVMARHYASSPSGTSPDLAACVGHL